MEAQGQGELREGIWGTKMFAFVLLDWAVTLIHDHHQTQYYHEADHPPTIVGPVIEVDSAHPYHRQRLCSRGSDANNTPVVHRDIIDSIQT